MARGGHKRIALACVVVITLGVASGFSTAFAETVTLTAILNSAAEVPPNSSKGSGKGSFTYNTDTKQLRYTIIYEGLTGPAIAGHIHGPAAPGANADIVVPFAVPESPISGTATLTDEQATAFLGQQLYVNIHTAANKSGEIRGQIMK